MAFEDILNMNLGDAKAPPVFPIGNYLMKVGEYRLGESKQKKTLNAEFEIFVMEPKSGVDLEAFSAAGIDLAKRKLRATFYLTEDAVYRFREFAEKCGVEVEGLPLKQALSECQGKLIVGYVTQEPSGREGDQRMFNNITGWQAAD